MALLFPQCSFAFSPLSYSNKGDLHLGRGGQMRVPPLKKRGEHLIRCDTISTPIVEDGGVVPINIPSEDTSIKISDFPTDFKFGASTSALQGVNVKRYCVWPLLDCMELNSGYTMRLGLNYTDYDDDLKRRPKKSAIWFRKFLKKD